MFLIVYFRFSSGPSFFPQSYVQPAHLKLSLMCVALAALNLVFARAVFRARTYIKDDSTDATRPQVTNRGEAYFFAIGFLVLGSLLSATGTYVFATVHYGRLTAEALVLGEDAHLMEASARTLDAYLNEPVSVKIYALSQYLITLEQAKKLSKNPLSMYDKRIVARIMMETHGRLAKLYSETGETNLSEQQVKEALQCAAEAGDLTVTNQTTLAESVAKLDAMVVRARSRVTN